MFDVSVNGLLGFDCRYIGYEENRLRYRKIKGEDREDFYYFTEDVLEASKRVDKIIVVESAVDAESLRHLGYPVLAVLSVRGLTHKLCAFLMSLYKKVVICLDNDQTGKQALRKFLEGVQKYPEIFTRFGVVQLPMKDVNDVLCSMGRAAISMLFSGILIS
jgi:DNA primase